jgi:hypothetical protein
LLKAIAQKLIPGIPEGSRIAILQQTKLTESDEDDKTNKDKKGEGAVLQEVIERATARSVIEQEIKGILTNIISPSLRLYISIQFSRTASMLRIHMPRFGP